MHKDTEKHSSTKLLLETVNVISHTKKSCRRKFIHGLQSLEMVSVLYNLCYYHMHKSINYITPQKIIFDTKIEYELIVRGKVQ